MGQSFKVLVVHQLLNVITCVPAGEDDDAAFFFFFLIKSRKRRGEDGVVIERTSNISWRHISLLDQCDKLCRVSQSYRIRIKTAFICQGHRMHKETDLDNWCRNSDHKGSLVPSLWLFSVVALQHEWVFKVDVFCFGCDAFCGS